MNNQQRRTIVRVCGEVGKLANDLARFYETGCVGLATLNDAVPKLRELHGNLEETWRAACVNADRLYTASEPRQSVHRTAVGPQEVQNAS